MHARPIPPRLSRLRRQQGLSLIELLVGLTIGLLTIAVAIGTLVISRQIANTTNDASQLQQQAAQAFRSIGQQARQAGSIRLNLASAKDSTQAIDAGDGVAFELSKDVTTVGGKTTPGKDEYQLVLGYRSYTENLVGSDTPQSQFRDCLGQAPSTTAIRSGFVLKKASGATSGELTCAGTGDDAQPVISNVADFRVRFVEQQANVTTGIPTMQYRTADSVAADAWARIHAVEVCLEMEGSELLPDTGAATQYVNCANQTVERGNRLRMVFRNTYQIRSQGRPTPAALMTALRQRQRGVSLLIVIVIVLLTMLMTVWASKTALLNEMIVGNDADYQRAFEAAEAMLQDAEQDILGQNIDGSACTPSASDTKICRRAGTIWFIEEDKDFVALLATLEAASNVPCINGICAKRTGKQDFWNDAALLTQMRATNVAARYGEYTGAQKGSYSNPILQATASGTGAWYWVEVMPYASNAGALITNNPRAEQLALNLNPALVYRITAIAQGLKPGTQVVLQATLARQKIKD